MTIVDRRRPATLEEASAVLSDCHQHGTAVFPVGGGSALDVGQPGSRPGMLFETDALDAVDDYPSEDMTITIGAGVRLDRLAAILAEKNQCLPIDAGDADRATLGGALATNASGPRRYGYGTLRDYLIGVDVLDAEGQRVHGGGRVVKNVAGYDFMKMHTGAFGSLGVIVQATLKLRPLPEKRAAVIVSLDDGARASALDALHATNTRPVAIELLNQAALQDLDPSLNVGKPWALVILLEESAAAVAWQLATLSAEGLAASATISDGPDYDRLLARLTATTARTGGRVGFKATTRPSQLVARLDQFSSLPNARLCAHAGNGVIWGGIDVESAAPPPALVAIERSLARDDGTLMYPRVPLAWKKDYPVFGQQRPEWAIMRRLKTALDPKGILNPGRFTPAESTGGG